MFIVYFEQKGCGYHLDMLIVGVMMGVCSVLGLPWCVAATVLCLGHVDSLKMDSESSAPGETPQFVGVREQRVTGICVFLLTGLSVKLAPILKFIPMPASIFYVQCKFILIKLRDRSSMAC